MTWKDCVCAAVEGSDVSLSNGPILLNIVKYSQPFIKLVMELEILPSIQGIKMPAEGMWGQTGS